jgi:hypothetical protein
MAAGLGFKTFTTGEVLTAADTNGYLMQGVLVFASEAARNAAITSPQEGQFAYTKDNNSLWYYTGSAWAASGATGDIEGVTAGTGISGGGTSGTVTITNSMATAIDAKGDLVAGTGADTFSKLTVGANGTILTADSAEATGLKWAAAAGGSGLTLIQRSTFTNVAGTSTTFDGVFTGTYISYIIEIENLGAATSSDDTQFVFRQSGASSANHYGNSMQNAYNSSAWSNTSSANVGYITICQDGATPTDPLGGQIFVTNTGGKNALMNGYVYASSGASYHIMYGNNVAAGTVTGFLLKSASSNVTGTVAVYGLAK